MTQCCPRPSVPGGLLTLALVAICLCSCSGIVSGTNHTGSNGGLLLHALKANEPGTRFTISEKRQALSIYNILRNSVFNAANMNRLEWHEDTERATLNWLRDCDVLKRPPIVKRESTTVRVYVPTSQKGTWQNSFYNWVTDTRSLSSIKANCKRGTACAAYRQMIYAKSESVACAKKYCQRVKNHPSVRSGYIIACLHKPGANVKGLPFKSGSPASQCPNRFKYVVFNLCSRRPLKAGRGSGSSALHANKLIIVAMGTILIAWKFG